MSIPKALRFTVLVRDGFTCRYCGRKAPDVVLEVDHRYPRSRGGSDAASNLVSACFDCNRGKRSRVLPRSAPHTRSDRAALAIGWTYGTLEMMGEYSQVDGFDIWYARDLTFAAAYDLMEQTLRWMRETPEPRPKASDYLRGLIRAHRSRATPETRCG